MSTGTYLDGRMARSSRRDFTLSPLPYSMRVPPVPAKARDGDDMRAGQRELGTGQVILAQPADAPEQVAARRVVEILGGKALAGQRKPRDDVLAKSA